MADAYWRVTDGLIHPVSLPPVPSKRPRTDHGTYIYFPSLFQLINLFSIVVLSLNLQKLGFFEGKLSKTANISPDSLATVSLITTRSYTLFGTHLYFCIFSQISEKRNTKTLFIQCKFPFFESSGKGFNCASNWKEMLFVRMSFIEVRGAS